MADVALTTDGITGKLLIDGHNISHAVSAVYLDFTTAGRDLPTVTVDLVATTASIDSHGARIELDDTTRRVLETLGWTPPAGDTAT